MYNSLCSFADSVKVLSIKQYQIKILLRFALCLLTFDLKFNLEDKYETRIDAIHRIGN